MIRKAIFSLLLSLLAVSALSARDITLLEGEYKMTWGPECCIDPMKYAGLAAGDSILVSVKDLGNYPQCSVRDKQNGWKELTPALSYFLVKGDFSFAITDSIAKQMKHHSMMFSGSNFTITKIVLRTSRPVDTRVGYDDLCDKNASWRTRQIYQLLRDVYGKKAISCSMAEVNWNYKEAGYVKALTGKYPAMNGFDYIHLTYGWEPYKDITPVKEWWDMGGLVTICWHWRAPSTEAQWDAYQKDTVKDPPSYDGFYAPSGGSPSTTFSPKEAVKEGTWQHDFLMADLKKVADRLEILQDSGIVVLWRPFHEAAGNSGIYPDGKAWFWWGADGPEPCKQLWHIMYDYFQQRGLHNLIWVWNCQINDDDWYPGDNYVDIIGRDLYNYTATPKDSTDEQAKYNSASWSFEFMHTYYPHKMLTLSECGNSPMMTDMWAAGARWLYAMPWYHYRYQMGQKHQWAGSDWWQNWFSMDNVITMDEMKTLRAQYLREDPTTDIRTVSGVKKPMDENWYTLQGVRIAKPVFHGVYIHKGKAVIIP
ncbi:MAG: glycosyl hydrolase [Prevotella sp.]|nr:glycosyl hydrolase [Prevotella sp.]